jgi:SAM-dependent methyltransferase
LDVPCGGGRLSLELAARGYRPTGVDIAQSLLDQGQAQANARGLAVDWACRDMRDLPNTEKFDAALCWWSSFGYFDEAGNLDFLKAVAKSLKPGAPLLLDTPLVETRLPEMIAEERVWWPVGDLLALEERTFDHVTSRVESEWTLVRGGQVEKKLLSLRLYTYRELTQLLEEAGFAGHQAYGSLEWEPFELGAPWLYLLTRKV